MSSWYSNWLPNIPSLDFALPSVIQHRFITFVLKKSLGHFLKPGQLDGNQVDSQISSGFVQVRDLELDNDAINTALCGLPVQLNHGSIASVTARIPWPNPLTSTLGLYLESLNLEFHLVPTPVSTPLSTLAESVVSVADSFLHDELNPSEEATLRQSFHTDFPTSPGDSHNVPGGLDPFLATPEDEHIEDGDPEGISIFAALIERLLARFEFDAVDTRITLVDPGRVAFTLLIQKVLYGTDRRSEPEGATQTRWEDSRDGQTWTISISGVRIAAQDLLPPFSSTPATVSPVSPRRSMHSPVAFPRSRSSSSSSSLDEESQFLMSQSVVSLPPRPVSPSSSVASSMYQSAMSTTDHGLAQIAQSSTSSQRSNREDFTRPNTPLARVSNPVADVAHPDSEPETLLSFGADPIVIELKTSPPARSAPRTPSVASNLSSSSGTELPGHAGSDNLHLSVTCGVIACALRAWHIRSLLELAGLWESHSPPTSFSSRARSASSPNELPISTFGSNIEGSIKVRAIVVLALSSKVMSAADEDCLRSGYFSHPLAPPQLLRGYARLHLEALSSSFALNTSASKPASTSSRSPTSPTTGRLKAKPRTTTSSSFALSLSNVSIFAFYVDSLSNELVASPILITDPQLPLQYSRNHIHPEPYLGSPPRTEGAASYPHLPTFDIIDWTADDNRTSAAKVSTWRTKVRAKDHRYPDLSFARPDTPAVIISGKRVLSSPPPIREGKASDNVAGIVDVEVVPLLLFADLALLLGSGGLSSFTEEATPSGRNDGGSRTYQGHRRGLSLDEDSSGGEGNTPPATPRAKAAEERDKERGRLEKLVVDDLGLDIEYRPQARPAKGQRLSTLSTNRSLKGKERARRNPQPSKLSLRFPLVRLQVRCPSPPPSSQRSGALVIDLHDLWLSTRSPSKPKPVARFGDPQPFSPSPSNRASRDMQIFVGFQRMIVATSTARQPKATAVLSLGPWTPAAHPPNTMPEAASATAGGRHDPQAVHPRMTVTKMRAVGQPLTPEARTTLVLTVDIPSLHVHVSKSTLDSLIYWADDTAQLLERSSGTAGDDTDTEDPSLIGSRFFARSLRSRRSGSGSGSAMTVGRSDALNEIVVKLVISESFVRMMVTREQSVERPFDVFGPDLELLLEVKPEGKDEMVLTLGVMGLTVLNTAPDGIPISLMSPNPPESLLSSPKPMVKLRFTSLVVPETTAKESRIKLTLWGFTYTLDASLDWTSDLALFFKSPPGAFESVIPNECTRVSVKIVNGSIRAVAPSRCSALLIHVGDLDFSTKLVGDSTQAFVDLSVPALTLLLLDAAPVDGSPWELTPSPGSSGPLYWKEAGYALLAEVVGLALKFAQSSTTIPPDTRVMVDHAGLTLHLCADTLTALTAFVGDWTATFAPPASEQPTPLRGPTTISGPPKSRLGIMSSLDEDAFKRVPEVGPAPDMINDDLPTNLDYLDESFGAAAGLRELRDDDVDEFDNEDLADLHGTGATKNNPPGLISSVGGETIRVLRPQGIQIVENYFDELTPESTTAGTELGETALQIRLHNLDITLLLYDGYDWATTRKTIEQEVKEMRRRLAKIRQLVASGQTQDPDIEEETSALLFNSVYIGLEQDVEGLEPAALVAAIDEELNDDLESASQSSWQSLKPSLGGKLRGRSTRLHAKRLTRSRVPSIEFCLTGVDAEVDRYRQEQSLVSRTFAIVKDLEILDHIKTSTWKKFLTELRSDSSGNVRETDSHMVQVELRFVRPVPGHPSEEARFRAKLLPLRLYVDQDAVDFLKKFFSFKDPHAQTSSDSRSSDDIFIQFAEVFPVDIKLDYKPRRVDYRALREGRTIELMNFFHFDGAEMTLRHISLYGITGWPRLFEMLNDLWTPDVKATQLVDVISGVSPIRSVVNVGSGVADLVLLPIAQYKKDGRIVRGVQKGTTAFVKSTAMEAVKLGARLATGTQVILEQAEGVLGEQFTHSITAETLQVLPLGHDYVTGIDREDDHGEPSSDLISKYAEQPGNIREGVQTAYRSLQRNFHSAAQTILAVPMEVYEKSGNEGAVRAVIRAVPVAVLKPMIGASEAVSKTLLGLQNTMDPDIRHETEAKYKKR